MTWFIFAFLTAFFSATEAAVLKKNMGDLRPLDMAAYPMFYSIPLFLAALFFLEKPDLSPGFWPALLTLLPINLLAVVLYNVAIRISPLSLTMPFLAFTPVLVIGTGYLMLGEQPNIAGTTGIIAVVGGSYVLNLNTIRTGLLEPIRAIFREKGSVVMLCVAAIFGLTAVLGKKIVLESSPLYAGALFFLLHNALFVLLFLICRPGRLRYVLARPRWGAAVGILFFAHILCHFSAVALVTTAYMIAVKRLNGLFGVIYGGALLKEQNLRYRLLGTGLMSLGAAVIAIWG